jgi:protein TonB
MNNSFLSNDNLDEVVFESRNKQYGAYQLRKSYQSNIFKSIFFTFSLMALGLMVIQIGFLLKQSLPPIGVSIQTVPLDMIDISNQKIEIISNSTPLTSTTTTTTTSAKHSEVFEINKDDLVSSVQPIIANILLETNTKGNEVGTAGSLTGTAQVGASGLTETGTDNQTSPPFEYSVSEMPTFPGGLESMMKFLHSEIIYPTQARENGVEGKVVLSFIVQTDGSIAFLNIEKSLGFGCDAEALRVVALMPKWNAGKQNGKYKAVKLVLPIVFKLQ